MNPGAMLGLGVIVGLRATVHLDTPPAPLKVYFVPLSRTPRPAPVWLPIPYNFLHCAIEPSPYCDMDICIIDDAPSPVEPTLSTRDPESVSVDEYVQKFQN